MSDNEQIHPNPEGENDLDPSGNAVEEAARAAQALARLGISMEDLQAIARGEIPSLLKGEKRDYYAWAQTVNLEGVVSSREGCTRSENSLKALEEILGGFPEDSKHVVIVVSLLPERQAL